MRSSSDMRPVYLTSIILLLSVAVQQGLPATCLVNRSGEAEYAIR
jgi:hypothetical protein